MVSFCHEATGLDDFAAAIDRVVDYLWEDERSSYLETPRRHRPHHIFRALATLSRWLELRNRTATRTKPLPPDPEEKNEIRAQSADLALMVFQGQTGADIEDAVSDLLADVMHWCDRHGREFHEELRRARSH